MENELLGIGKVAALSGLPVSALRFYDGAGVLVPSSVDPSSGYRFYRPDQVRAARLVAHLRRVGLPLDDIRTVLADRALAGRVLAAHLARLEAGLVDARREISIVHQLLETTENRMHRHTLSAAALVHALREVRYAVSTDPDQARLNGVYLDSEPGRVRVVATDRHRLAISAVTVSEPTDLNLLLPTAMVDDLLASDASGSLEVIVDDGTVSIAGDGLMLRARIPDVDFPSYRSLLEHGEREVPVDAAQLRAALEAAPSSHVAHDDGGADEVSLLTVSEAGVRVGTADGHDGTVVAVNRRFMLEALEAGDQLTLAIDDPIAPLAIRNPEREGTMSVLMPVRLDQSA